ncbi:MAG: cytidine deaminase [Bacteroidales bacterium]|nr:cytidine deaminase [Bacteroidales bacterium]
MKVRHIQIHFEEYAEGEQLPPADLSLINEARQAVNTSYAPYSEFRVGAAVLLENGLVVKGSNQENASYPLGLCAERVALFHASSVYPELKVVAIAITAKAQHFITTTPITPCGACRQVMAETENRQGTPIRIIMRGQQGVAQIVNGIGNLLPLSFKEEKLKKKREKTKT